MLIVSGSIRLKAGDRTDLLDATSTMMAKSRAEDGCRAYRFTFDLDDPDLVHVYEEWDDDESLRAHFAEPHFAEFGIVINDWVAERGEFALYEVGEARPLR